VIGGSWFYDEQQTSIVTYVYQLMSNTRKLITLDRAIKRLLRSKYNFGIPEGFLSELLKEEITLIFSSSR
jgi:hypothetical protein